MAEASPSGNMSARSIETCDEADCHRVIAQSEHDWNGVVSSRGLRRPRRVRSVSNCEDHCHAHPYELGCQRREPVVVALCPSVFNLYILTICKAGFFQFLPKCISEECGEMLAEVSHGSI
jgi:hypothetical protein